MNHHKINYIELGAKDLTKMRAFYGDIFGWTFTEYGPEYLAFNDGNMDGGFDIHAPIGKAPLVILYSKEIEKTLEAVLKAGGTIALDIFAFPGGRRFHFVDPSGNELAVWSDK